MSRPQFSAVLELLKPITWFPPMWAHMCGVVSSGVSGRWLPAGVGAVLAGPLVWATSQAFNDWFDRHLDAINEPGRPKPSGRCLGRRGLYVGCFWSVLSIVVGATLGPWGLVAAFVGLALARAYSAPPFRLKHRTVGGAIRRLRSATMVFRGQAAFFNQSGITPYVLGMLVSAFALPAG
jgi:chlorophyll synthase